MKVLRVTRCVHYGGCAGNLLFENKSDLAIRAKLSGGVFFFLGGRGEKFAVAAQVNIETPHYWRSGRSQRCPSEEDRRVKTD